MIYWFLSFNSSVIVWKLLLWNPNGSNTIVCIKSVLKSLCDKLKSPSIIKNGKNVKVTKEKAMQERAWEARDKKIKRLEKLREENQMRAQHINERKRKKLKTIRMRN